MFTGQEESAALSAEQQELAQLWAAETGEPVENPAETIGGSNAEGSTGDPEAGKQAETTTETAAAAPAEAASTTEGTEGPKETDIEVDFTPPAWVQLLPEDVRDQAVKDFRSSRSNVKANAVRVTALTKHLDETRAKLAAAEAAGQQVPKFVLPEDATIDEIRKDFPDMAAWLEKTAIAISEQSARHNQAMLNPLREAVQVQANALAETVNEATADDVARARQQVLQVVPDAAETARSEAFQSWLSQQSPGIQRLRASKDPSDNITLFTLYKGSLPKPSDKLKLHAELPKKGGAVIPASDDDIDDPTVFWQREFQKNKQ